MWWCIDVKTTRRCVRSNISFPRDRDVCQARRYCVANTSIWVRCWIGPYWWMSAPPLCCTKLTDNSCLTWHRHCVSDRDALPTRYTQNCPKKPTNPTTGEQKDALLCCQLRRRLLLLETIVSQQQSIYCIYHSISDLIRAASSFQQPVAHKLLPIPTFTYHAPSKSSFFSVSAATYHSCLLLVRCTTP